MSKALREAFTAGVEYAVEQGVDRSNHPVSECKRCQAEVRRRYPPRTEERARELKIGVNTYRAVNGRVELKLAENLWAPSETFAAGRIERYLKIADLLANPTELVEVDD